MILWLGLIMLIVTTLAAEQKVATLEYINSICGQESLDFNTNKYPWTAAVFKIEEYGNLKSYCGGSLVSTKTIVTVAHCYNNYGEPGLLRPQDFLVFMAGNNAARIERIIQHPDYSYNPEKLNFDSDLALILLKQPIIFSTSVKPICLWTESNDESAIVDKPGVIAAWNPKERLTNTSLPILFNATVISEAICLRSNQLISKLKSKRTLCVDILDKENLCKVISGNGLMVQIEKKWMLRATVAGALKIEIPENCMVQGYFIFSDTAQFNEWILSNMVY